MPQQYYYPYNVYNLWILNLDLFYRQMRYLYENNFNTVTSEQLINFLYYDGDLPPNPIVLTFDDGYLDNALFAAPILRQFGFTGMVFMFTVQIPPETPTMTSSPAFMSAELMLANKDVFEFGSHTHGLHHRIDGVAAMQVVDYARIVVDLRRSFEHPLNLLTGFAYPFGQYNDNAIAALQSEGILFAFTTRFAYAYRNTDPFRIPRFLVTSAPQWYDKEFFSDIVHGRRE
jgi:peptidoglycan/xylan/chitin deacetylase (PgdA/CDA1 family)